MVGFKGNKLVSSIGFVIPNLDNYIKNENDKNKEELRNKRSTFLDKFSS